MSLMSCIITVFYCVRVNLIFIIVLTAPKCLALVAVRIDAVVAVNSAALDAVLHAAGPLEINGTMTNASGIDIIREEDWGNGVSRGDAVLDIVKAAAQKAKDPSVKSAMINAALDQYSKGNIIMDQQGAFVNLLASKGIENFFG